jgi:hypothetical protein
MTDPNGSGSFYAIYLIWQDTALVLCKDGKWMPETFDKRLFYNREEAVAETVRQTMASDMTNKKFIIRKVASAELPVGINPALWKQT